MTKLTTRQQRFVRELIENPTLPKAEIAVRAGYSPTSAQTIAYRLLRNPRVQSELGQHFLDAEAEVSGGLRSLLQRLRTTIENPKTNTRLIIQAGKLLMEYARLSSTLLGLQVKLAPSPITAEPEPLTIEETIAAHEQEITKLRDLRDRQQRLDAQRLDAAGPESPPA